MRVQVKITGIPEVKAALESLPPAVAADAMGDTLYEAAKPIADAARANAPVRIGKLRASIRIALRARGQGERVKARRGAGIFIGSTSPVAHLQEFGAPQHAPQPFMRPALDAKGATARRMIEQGFLTNIRKAVERARQKAAKR